MIPPKIFIDTEFTDFSTPRLISIGLAANSGEEFYAELNYPAAACSDFVRSTVIPLLGRIPDAYMSNAEIFSRLSNWLRLVNPTGGIIDICYDFQTDWDLFSIVLKGSIPPWCQPRLISSREINELLRYDYHQVKKLPEHHALYDAQAIRYAYREPRPIAV